MRSPRPSSSPSLLQGLPRSSEGEEEGAQALFFAFAAAGQALLELTLKRANLEDIFLELTENGEAAGQAPAGETTEEPEGARA